MRKIKDILRLRQEAGLSYRSISQALNIGYGTVVDYLERAESASVNWPLPAELNERELGRLLFPTQPRTGQRRFAAPEGLGTERSFFDQPGDGVTSLGTERSAWGRRDQPGDGEIKK